MADELKIKVSVAGGDAAKKQLVEIADAEKRVGVHADEAGKKAAEAHGKAAGAADHLLTSVKGLVGGYLGLQGVLKVLGAIREEHERAVEVTRRHAEALREVLSLSALQGERPQTIRAVQAMAVSSGRPVEQVAAAYNTLLGGTAGMDRGRQQGLMQEALAHGKAAPTASLESLVNLFATTATQAPQLSPRQISNLLSVAGEQAKGTVGEIATSLPNVMSAASAGGMGPEVAAATFSFVTRSQGGVRKSGTAATAALLGLLAPQGDTAKLLARAGMPAGDLGTRVAWLSQNADKLPPEAMAALGGREGIGAVAAIAKDPAGYQAEIAMMQKATAMPGSHIGGRLASLYGEVPAQRYLDQVQQMKVMQDVQRNDPAALRGEAIVQMRSAMRQAMGLNPLSRGISYGIDVGLTGVGLGMPEDAYDEAMRAMLDAGYQPADIIGVTKGLLMQGGYDDTGMFKSPAGWNDRNPAAATKALQTALRSRGLQPMQGATNIIIGGTTHINQDKAEPAGKPIPPAIRD